MRDAAALEQLVGELELEGAVESQLLGDAKLIAEWYLEPEVKVRIRLGRKHEVRQLETAAALAHDLHMVGAGQSVAFDELFDGLCQTKIAPLEVVR